LWFHKIINFNRFFWKYQNYYQEPFYREWEWDVFFRESGPYIEPGYLNSYRFKLKTVRDEPFQYDINVVSIDDWISKK
jgi:hypothetical protein